MTVERKNNEIIIKIPSNLNPDMIQDIIDFVEFQQNNDKTQASQSDIDQLANEVNKSIWKKFKKQREL